MTALPARLATIRAKLEAATEGPWFLSDCEGELVILPESDLVSVERAEDGTIEAWGLPTVYRIERRILEVELDSWDEGEDEQDDQIRANATFIASAPTTVARLLAAVEAVVELAENWEARGEHDMAFSRVVENEDVAMSLLTNGADMVENARHIRTALSGALGKEEGHVPGSSAAECPCAECRECIETFRKES